MSTTTTHIGGMGIDDILRQEAEQTRRRRSIGRYLRLMRDNPLGTFGLIVIITLFVVGALAPWLAPYSYSEIAAGSVKADPSLAHPFGTDDLGRDMFSRVIAGARISLLVGFISVFSGIAIGMFFGITSGYFGGWVDNLIQRTVDTIIAFPGLIFLLIIIRVLGPNMRNVIIVIALITIFPVTRIVRGATLSEKNNQYVEAARSIGASAPRILFRHLLPNILPLGIVLATIGLGAAILAESGLSFLGLGIPPPNPSWGTDISLARNNFPIHIWWAFFPGAAISLVVLGFNLLGDSIRDIADPRLRGSR
jgi:peptide/nickel transport system permease protein